jgi:general secretion pathway protein F
VKEAKVKSFHYRAVSLNNDAESGVVQAISSKDAARKLLDRGLYPTELAAQGRSLGDILSAPIFEGKLSTSEQAQVLSDLGNLLGAGIELAVALGIVSAGGTGRATRTLLEKVAQRVRTGHPLSEALSEKRLGFPEHVIAVVRAGEISGSLPAALGQVANTVKASAGLRSRVRTALIYPSCISLAAAAAIFVLVAVVVPTLEGMVSDASKQLPWQTQLLVIVGRSLRDHWTAILIAMSSGTVIAAILLRRPFVRTTVEKYILGLPLVGGVLASAETARLTRILSTLAAADLPMASAAVFASKGAQLQLTRNSLVVAGLKVREGAKLHDALLEVSALSSRALSLIQIGETTGRLTTMLEEAARDAEARVDQAVDRILALLTPVLTLLFGAIAGFVLYAVMTAILSVNQLAIGSR